MEHTTLPPLLADGQCKGALHCLGAGMNIQAHGSLTVGYIRINVQLGNVIDRTRYQLHAAHHAVPVGAGVLGSTVCPLVHGVLQSVVHTQGDGVHARCQLACQIETVGAGEAFVRGNGIAVHIDCGLPVAALQRKDYVPTLPVLGDYHFTLIPCLAAILILAAQAVHMCHHVLHALASLVGGAWQGDGLGQLGGYSSEPGVLPKPMGSSWKRHRPERSILLVCAIMPLHRANNTVNKVFLIVIVMRLS